MVRNFSDSRPCLKMEKKKFLKALKSKRVEACLALAKSIKQKYIYEIELKGKGVDNKTEDFVLPEWRATGWGVFF